MNCGIGSCRRSRRGNVWELLWYWEGCGGRCWVDGRCIKGVGVGACASSTGIDQVDEAVAADVGATAAVGRVGVVICTRSTDVGGNVAVGFGLTTVVEGVGIRGCVGRGF